MGWHARRSRCSDRDDFEVSEPIIVTRQVKATPEVVYEYLTESDKWAMWQGATATIEAHPGGRFMMTMPDGSMARGEFVDLVPPRRVVFTWGWVDHPGVPPGSSTVEIEIAASAEGSQVTITHRGLPAEEIEVHTLGWAHYLPRLGAAAAGDDPGPDHAPAESNG